MKTAVVLFVILVLGLFTALIGVSLRCRLDVAGHQPLLSNATKYSPNGGTVRISAQKEGERIRISVADQGIGIPTGDKGRGAEPAWLEGIAQSNNLKRPSHYRHAAPAY